MIDPSQMAAPMPQGDPAALAAMLGGGGAPAGMDPAAMGGDPSMGMQPAGGNPYPTADPNFMAQMLGQVMEAQQQDQQQLQTDQQAALMGNPLMQGLLSGAPMGPGAGQDGAGIDMGSQLPEPPQAY